MRLRADIFVSALLRRVFASGDFAAVEKKGAEEAGAIFIRQHFRDGLETLYAPAPQTAFDEGQAGDRLFEIRLSRSEPEAVRAMIPPPKATISVTRMKRGNRNTSRPWKPYRMKGYH